MSSLFERMCPFSGWQGINQIKYEKKNDLFKQKYSIMNWGKVDWNKFEQKTNIGYSLDLIISSLEELINDRIDTSVYLEWSSGDFPIISANLNRIIEYFDIVSKVAFEKFIFSPTQQYVVEIIPSGQITAGIFPTSDKFFQKKTYINPRILEEDQVFKECVDSLKTSLLPVEEEKRLDDWFKAYCPITKWGRVDWQQFSKKEKVGYEIKSMKRALTKFLGMKGPYDTTAYIEWSEVGMPVIKTTLGDIIGNFADIEPVSFEKFIFNPEFGYVIEILHSREMTMGIVPAFDPLKK